MQWTHVAGQPRGRPDTAGSQRPWQPLRLCLAGRRAGGLCRWSTLLGTELVHAGRGRSCAGGSRGTGACEHCEGPEGAAGGPYHMNQRFMR
jgi:hypothetical protein